MVASMAPNPVIFAMANPDRDYTEEAHARAPRSIVADGTMLILPNQVNNVLGFSLPGSAAPLDIMRVPSMTQMKIACAVGSRGLAR